MNRDDFASDEDFDAWREENLRENNIKRAHQMGMPVPMDSRDMTDEEFLIALKNHNSSGIVAGIQQGWWESIDENKNPVPFPKKLSIESHPTMAHVVVALGIFSSLSQAKKNGFDRPSSRGIHSFTKKNIRAEIT